MWVNFFSTTHLADHKSYVVSLTFNLLASWPAAKNAGLVIWAFFFARALQHQLQLWSSSTLVEDIVKVTSRVKILFLLKKTNILRPKRGWTWAWTWAKCRGCAASSERVFHFSFMFVVSAKLWLDKWEEKMYKNIQKLI